MLNPFSSRQRPRPWLAVILVLTTAAPLFATRIRPLNLEEMTERADRIFLGRCVSIQVARDPATGSRVTFADFRVERAAKGDLHGIVRIKLLGEQDQSLPHGRGVPGLPRFAAGEEVVLFLYGDSRRGFTSPVGFGQGKFTVFQDKQGRSQAVNAFRNENLFLDLSEGVRRRLNLDPHAERGGGAIPPDRILDMVETLRNRPAGPPGGGPRGPGGKP